jgi:hypothetical protein
MLSMSAKSKYTPEELIKRAVAFFGPGGYGLTVNEEGNCCVNFTGAAAASASPPRPKKRAALSTWNHGNGTTR